MARFNASPPFVQPSTHAEHQTHSALQRPEVLADAAL